MMTQDRRHRGFCSHGDRITTSMSKAGGAKGIAFHLGVVQSGLCGEGASTPTLSYSLSRLRSTSGLQSPALCVEDQNSIAMR